MIKNKLIYPLVLLTFATQFLLCACGVTVGPPQEVDTVPAGDPAFPPLSGLVIDTTNQISSQKKEEAEIILESLRDDGIAEVVIVVIKGVKHPELWATRFGRHDKVGSSATDNGLVYLIRPDAPTGERITYSVGRGLPQFVSGDVTDAVARAKPLIDTGRIAEAIPLLAEDTAQILRQDYKSNPDGVPEQTSDEEQMTPEQARDLLVTVLVIAAIWFVVGLAILPFDAETAFQWWLLGLRVLVLILSRGQVDLGRKSGSKFGGRSGTR